MARGGNLAPNLTRLLSGIFLLFKSEARRETDLDIRHVHLSANSWLFQQQTQIA